MNTSYQTVRIYANTDGSAVYVRSFGQFQHIARLLGEGGQAFDPHADQEEDEEEDEVLHREIFDLEVIEHGLHRFGRFSRMKSEPLIDLRIVEVAKDEVKVVLDEGAEG